MALLGSSRRVASGGGVNVNAGMLSPAEIAAKQQASQDAAHAAQVQQQTELNAAEDRARQIQQERDMAAAHRQNAVNVGGTASGEYGYAYPGGGGSGAGSGASRASGGGGSASPAPQALDLSQLSSLKSQVAPPQVPPPSYAANNGVADQAFARAKDKAGLLALRRMADSRREFAQRGLSGGGGDARAMDSVLGDASSGLQDFALGQAQTEAGLARQATDRDYAGALQQRSQDISMIPTLLSLLRESQRSAVY